MKALLRTPSLLPSLLSEDTSILQQGQLRPVDGSK